SPGATPRSRSTPCAASSRRSPRPTGRRRSTSTRTPTTPSRTPPAVATTPSPRTRPGRGRWPSSRGSCARPPARRPALRSRQPARASRAQIPTIAGGRGRRPSSRAPGRADEGAMSGLVVDLLFQGKLVRTVSFDRPVLRIGRMRENDIVVDNLAVSRFHARLHLDAGRVFLEDGGSENGSWVNDRRVRGRIEVAPGDRIAIGKHELRVRSRQLGEASLDDAPTAPPEVLRSGPWDARDTYVAGPETAVQLRPASVAPPSEPSALASPEEPDSMSDPASIDAPDRDDFDFASPDLAAPVAAELAPAELAPAEPAGSPALDEASATVLLAEEEVDDAPAPAPPLHAGLIVQREGKIERVVAWEGDALTVGRSADCDLVLGQDEVSRRHARFVRDGDRYEVYDLGSVNGTLVNGRRADRHDLAVGDVIAIESFQLTFVLDREPIAGTVKPAPARPTLPMVEPEPDAM